MTILEALTSTVAHAGIPTAYGGSSRHRVQKNEHKRGDCGERPGNWDYEEVRSRLRDRDSVTCDNHTQPPNHTSKGIISRAKISDCVS